MMEGKRNKEILLLVAIILIGLFLNTFGLKWGLPEGDWHWDEKVRILTNMIKNRTLNPHYFNNPTLHTYLLGIWLAPYLLIIKLSGIVNGVQSWAEMPAHVKTNLFIIARLLSVFLGIATGYLTYLIGKKVFNRLTGIIAFLILILAPGFVTWSHFSTVDITSAFFSTFSLYYCIKIINKPTRRNYLLAGIFAGLALSTKYTAWILAVFILMAHFFSMVKQYGVPKIKNIIRFIYSKYLFIALCLMILCFFATNPFVLIGFGEFKQHILNLFGSLSSSARAKYSFFDWQAIHGLNSIFGTPTLILAALSIFFLVVKPREKKYHNLYLLISIMVYFIYLNSCSFVRPRYLIIILPFIAIAIGHFYSSIIKRGKALKVASTILISGALIYQVILSLCVDLCFTNDPKVQTRKWVMRNVSPNSIIHSHGYSAFVNLHLPSRYQVIDIPEMADTTIPVDKLKIFLARYNEKGPDYIIAPANHIRIHFSKNYYANTKGLMADYYTRLMDGKLGYKLVASFENKFPVKMDFLDPINRRVEIYKNNEE